VDGKLCAFVVGRTKYRGYGGYDAGVSGDWMFCKVGMQPVHITRIDPDTGLTEIIAPG
jgi:hypothetical protein